MQVQISDQQARKRIFIILMVIIWFAALVIAPYYIAKPELETINQQRSTYIAKASTGKLTQSALMNLQKPYTQQYTHYLAAVYVVFSAIWIFFPLVGIWVSINLKKRDQRKNS